MANVGATPAAGVQPRAQATTINGQDPAALLAAANTTLAAITGGGGTTAAPAAAAAATTPAANTAATNGAANGQINLQGNLAQAVGGLVGWVSDKQQYVTKAMNLLIQDASNHGGQLDSSKLYLINQMSTLLQNTNDEAKKTNDKLEQMVQAWTRS